MYYLFLNRRK